MIKTIKEDAELEWQKAHELNRQMVHDLFTKDFDQLTSKWINYDAIAFYEQWMWIHTTFYKTNGYNSSLPIKRIWSDGSDDEFINAPEVHETIKRKFGKSLNPFIDEMAIYFIGTTAGEKFMPSSNEAFAFKENTRFRNTYRATTIQPTQPLMVRPQIWQEFLDRLMPREATCITLNSIEELQQDFFEAYLAQRIQEPSKPPHVAILLRGEHGTGKNIWMNEVLGPLIGKSNLKQISLATVNSRFLHDVYQSTLLHIEEINDTKRKANETLKKLITEDTARVEQKNQPATTAKKYFGIILSSNVHDPIRIEENDRRYFIPFYSSHLIDQSETKQFFKRFVSWLNLEGGLQQMCNYMHSFKLSAWDFNSPPMTPDKQDLMETETSQVQKAEKASLELAAMHTENVIFSADVAKLWGINEYHAQRALRNAGFGNKKKRWGGRNPTWGWIHKSYEDSVSFDGLTLFNATPLNPSLVIN